ncbi:hypothetical protein STXM2123_2499 [Streptomyces sp. F-3]|nr:hypothetical protein STXM2123_2499 [Streptomyces sp. F-3]
MHQPEGPAPARLAGRVRPSDDTAWPTTATHRRRLGNSAVWKQG